MTDLTAQEGEILLFDDSVTMSAHSGILHVARNLYHKLLGKFILVVCKSYIFFVFMSEFLKFVSFSVNRLHFHEFT